MAYVRRMDTKEECDGCGDIIRKSVLVDDFADVTLECEECGYTEAYDGEPVSMIYNGVRG